MKATADPVSDALVFVYVVILFAVALLAWECLTGRKRRKW